MPSLDTDRNLLFAVLALQADVLSRERFVEACTLWASRKDVPIADLLAERGWISPDERADAERLVARKLAKHQGDARAGLAEATTDRVRESIAAVPDHDVRRSVLPASPPGQLILGTTAFEPEHGERYTVTRLHATGGIGRVWLAHDTSLGRDVALKELRPERGASPAVWARFVREAKITGQLEHPGIVPVYELGSRTDAKQPFYTMRFVRGRTLLDALNLYHQKRQRGEAGAVEFRTLLSAFVGVCNAIAYAHSRGVIHRDLKPANVALGDFGEVMVLDWGLAKVVGTDEEGTLVLSGDYVSDSQQTMAGQILGTPAYMAPEQADGDLARIDQRTDVYGLGAILYEILAGAPPFRGDSTDEVLRGVRHLQPQPPRERVKEVPAALNAICLKCLHKRPEDRYAGAKEVADDVQHFSADEPVGAYREPAGVRLRRWARRRSRLVGGTFLALAVAVPILVAGLILLDRSGRREREARKQAQANAEQAQTNAKRALASADLMANEMTAAIQPIPGHPITGVRKKRVLAVLDKARTVYDELLDAPDPPTEAIRGKAKLLASCAQLYLDMHQTGRCRDAAAGSIALYDRLQARQPDDREIVIERARVRHDLARAIFDQGYGQEAIDALRQCIEELEALDLSDRDDVKAGNLAGSYTVIANVLRDRKDWIGAEAAYQKGIDLRKAALAKRPNDSHLKISLGISLTQFGQMQVQTGKAAAPGLDDLRKAVREADAGAGSDQVNQLRRVDSRNNLLVYLPQSQWDEAQGHLKAAREIVDRHWPRDPDDIAWDREILRLRWLEGEWERKRPGAKPDALAAAKANLALLTQLGDWSARRYQQDPENYLWLADVANFDGRIAKARLDLARLKDAQEENVKQARKRAAASVATSERILSRDPLNAQSEEGLIYALWVLASAEVVGKDWPAAHVRHWAYLSRTLAFYHRLLQLDPNHPNARKQLSVRLYLFTISNSNALSPPGAEADWPQLLDRPEVVAALLDLARTFDSVTPTLPDDIPPKAEAAKAQIAVRLREAKKKGKLPAGGDAILARLPPEPKAPPAPKRLPLEINAPLKPFTPPGGRCRILLPGTPNDMKQGAMTMFGWESDGRALLVAFNDYAPGAVTPENVIEALDGAVKGQQTGMKALLRHTRPIAWGSQRYPGRDSFLDMKPKTLVRSRIVIVGDRLYQIMALGPAEFTLDPRVERIFKSFEVIAPADEKK